MRLIAPALAALAISLAACGPAANTPDAAKTEAASAVPAAPSFPSLTGASYRAESTITDENGRTMNLIQTRSGAKTRTEMVGSGSIQIVDPEAGAAYVIVPAQRMAMRMPLAEIGQSPTDMWAGLSADGAQPTPAGPCTVAGETGASWTLPAADGQPVRTACVSADGIFLKGTEGDRTTWEVTSVTRGPQDAALFVVPAGYRLQDMPGMAMKR